MLGDRFEIFRFDLIRLHETPPWLPGDEGNNNVTPKPKPKQTPKPAPKPAATPPNAQTDQAAVVGSEQPSTSTASASGATSRDELIAAIKLNAMKD